MCAFIWSKIDTFTLLYPRLANAYRIDGGYDHDDYVNIFKSWTYQQRWGSGGALGWDSLILTLESVYS